MKPDRQVMVLYLSYTDRVVIAVFIFSFSKKKRTICFLFPQTQEVQKAMDEKKFDEAVGLRGGYFNSF